MQDQELNQFAKYQPYSSYANKTKPRNIDSRNPLEFYQQNNIPTQNWDSTLLNNSRPIVKELDKIVFLADSLFIKTEQPVEKKVDLSQTSQIKPEQQEQMIAISTLLETTKSLQPEIHNQKVQSLANIKADLLDVAFNYTTYSNKQPIKQLYNIKTDSKKTLEQKGCQLKQSAPLSLYELRQIRDVEIQKALNTLQK